MTDVSVLGLGRMGSALAAMFLEGGSDITVWNRTADRGRAIVERGATAADSAAHALGASPISVICVDGYDTVLDLVETAGEPAVAGRAIVSLTSGTPSEASRAGAAVESLGGTYLDGHISVAPERIGDDTTIVVFSGAPTVWEAHAPTLRKLGGSSLYLGADVGAASLISAGLSAFFHTALLGFFEALVFARLAGLPMREFHLLTNGRLTTLGEAIDRGAAAVAEGRFEGATATLSSHAAAMRLFRDTLREAGCAGNLATEVVNYLDRAERDGKGELGLTAVTDVMGSRRSP